MRMSLKQITNFLSPPLLFFQLFHMYFQRLNLLPIIWLRLKPFLLALLPDWNIKRSISFISQSLADRNFYGFVVRFYHLVARKIRHFILEANARGFNFTVNYYIILSCRGHGGAGHKNFCLFIPERIFTFGIFLLGQF